MSDGTADAHPEHGFAAHVAEEGFSFSKAIVEDLFGVIFSAELDFFTQLCTVAVLVSLTIELIYLLSPRALKAGLEKVDCRPDGKQPVTLTGALAVTSIVAMASCMLQKNSYAKSIEEKMRESRIEKEFRHRTQFLLDMHTYQFVLIATVWLSLNIVMKTNRSAARAQATIDLVNSGKHPDQAKLKPEAAVKPDEPPKNAEERKADGPPKSAQDKKND